MIRVTPIDGEPIDVQDWAPALGDMPPYAFERRVHAVEGGCIEVCSDNGNMTLEPTRLTKVLDAGYHLAFVQIGEAWPLCEVETWRQRAERLDNELAAAHRPPEPLPRLPTAEEVAAHGKAHPVQGFGGTQLGCWLVFDGVPRFVLLSADEDGVWLPDGDMLTEQRVPAATWVPCTARGIPVAMEAVR